MDLPAARFEKGQAMTHARIAAAIATLLVLSLAAVPASAEVARKAEAAATAAPGEILLPTPSPRQLAWQELEIIAFVRPGHGPRDRGQGFPGRDPGSPEPHP